MTHVVVVGGGISGLSAARELAAAGLSVTLVESSHRWGGKLAAVRIDGVRLDTGAESVLARRPEAVTLVDDLGLGPDRVHPTEAKPQLLVGGRLRPLPPSVLGVPTDLEPLRPLLSDTGFITAQGRSGRDADVTGDLPIGAAVDQSFGPEVTDQLLEPLLGGVYAGRARELSFAAVAPELFRRARGGGSLLDHAHATVGPDNTTPVFAGVAGGVSLIVDRLLAELAGAGVELRVGATVRGLDRLSDDRFRLTVARDQREEMIMADAVVLATPAAPTGRLLTGLAAAAERFGQIPYASVAVATLVVRGLDATASGVLVPPGELPTIKALTHSCVKWDWVGRQAEQAWGSGTDVVRVSIGRIGEEALLQLDDDRLVARTWTEAAGLPGWRGATLVASAVTRWGGALPQYRVGHRDLVAALRAEVGGVRGLALAGAALDGVGVAACLGAARAAVTKIMTDLSSTRDGMEDAERRQESRT